ncbi:hypothetical protein EV132_103331 [Rhizobium sullae]|uniref:Uncharacterized protein n=1 Tax=Rhizobium sullae TaxID=50338 RepID=A0A4R3QA98_RHISU|nr:hypothetical protein EV132_103331 [Rhizobium sullae]
MTALARSEGGALSDLAGRERQREPNPKLDQEMRDRKASRCGIQIAVSYVGAGMSREWCRYIVIDGCEWEVNAAPLVQAFTTRHATTAAIMAGTENTTTRIGSSRKTV